MAEALSITDTSWSGPAASYMYTRAVVGCDTIEKGAIYPIDGIRKSRTIPRIEVSNFIQRRAATPISQGTVAVDGAVLTPKDMMLYYEFNPRDYEAHFYAEQLQDKILDRPLPLTAENFMVMQTMKRLNEFFENAIWRSRIIFDPQGAATTPASKGQAAGDSAYFYFDGLLTKALNTAGTVQVGSPVTLTQTNVRAQFQAALNLVPNALLFRYGAGGLKFLVGYTTQKLYEQALREDSFKNQDTTQKGLNMYSGYDVVPCAGIPDNTFFLCIAKPDTDSNLWLGMNSQEDENNLKLQQLQANSELWFVKGLFKMDTQIGFTDQLVIYTTITA